MSYGGDGFGGDVQLDVVGVVAEIETTAADDVTEGGHVEDEE